MSVTVQPTAGAPVSWTTGAGAPASTPTAIGAKYTDTTNGAEFIAKGTASSSDWVQIGGITAAGVPGYGLNASIQPVWRGASGGAATVNASGNITVPGGLVSLPGGSTTPTLALGTAFQNTTGIDEVIVVYLNVTANTSLVLKLGVGSTNTPAQQTIVTGITVVGLWQIGIYLPQTYFALLSASGTQTSAIIGQIGMAV